VDTANVLKKSQLFEGLDGDGLAAFAGIASEANFGPEELVYESGHAGDSLFVIVEGEFVVRVLDENQDEVDVAVLRPGSYFGEMEVFGGMNRTAAIVSQSDGRCCRFDAAEFLALLKGDDRLGAHVYKEVCKGLITRLQHTTRDTGYFKSRAC